MLGQLGKILASEIYKLSISCDLQFLSITRTPAHPRGLAPLSIVGYACGTCKMGNDPIISVVDKNCKSHDIDNLYISDASIFPSCPSIGHGLTVIALSIKLADYLTAENVRKPLICRP